MYNYLALGSDCSPGTTLRLLNLRDFAQPFDWVVSYFPSLERCLLDDFKYYHTNLHFNHNKKRLVDHYEFEFPHDYPLTDISRNDTIGDVYLDEEDGKTITDNWKNYYDIVKEKYDRRIERFRKIVNDEKPIIVLCRHHIQNVIKLQELFKNVYNKTNIIFINSSSQPFETPTIKNIYTERNGIWNEDKIWKDAIDKVVESRIFLD